MPLSLLSSPSLRELSAASLLQESSGSIGSASESEGVGTLLSEGRDELSAGLHLPFDEQSPDELLSV